MAKKKKKLAETSFGHSRSINDFRRRRGTRLPGKVVLIVCEGDKTEPNYFHALRQKFRLSNLSVRIIPGKGAPITIVNCAIQEKKNQDADEVWCVFDTENPNENPTLVDAITKAKKAKINLAISNPSFEYWYFIHFDPTSRPFANGQEMKRALRIHIPDYEENANVFPILDARTPEAIKNAETLRGNSHESWDILPNPSTGVDKLVQEVIEMGNLKRY